MSDFCDPVNCSTLGSSVHGMQTTIHIFCDPASLLQGRYTFIAALHVNSPKLEKPQMPTTVTWINKPEGIIQFNILPQSGKQNKTKKTPTTVTMSWGLKT